MPLHRLHCRGRLHARSRNPFNTRSSGHSIIMLPISDYSPVQATPSSQNDDQGQNPADCDDAKMTRLPPGTDMLVSAAVVMHARSRNVRFLYIGAGRRHWRRPPAGGGRSGVRTRRTGWVPIRASARSASCCETVGSSTPLIKASLPAAASIRAISFARTPSSSNRSAFGDRPRTCAAVLSRSWPRKRRAGVQRLPTAKDAGCASIDFDTTRGCNKGRERLVSSHLLWSEERSPMR